MLELCQPTHCPDGNHCEDETGKAYPPEADAHGHEEHGVLKQRVRHTEVMVHQVGLLVREPTLLHLIDHDGSAIGHAHHVARKPQQGAA